MKKAVTKQFLKQIQPYVTENPSILSRRLAALWLEKYSKSPISKHLLSNYFSSIDHTQHSLKNILERYPVGLEGAHNHITPEIIALLDEFLSTKPHKQGIFYTPYDLAQLLARELLNTWLKKCGYTLTHLPLTDSPQSLHLDRKLAQISVCDPCVGAGGLLVPFWLELTDLRLRLSSQNKRNVLLVDIAQHNLYAADLRPQALEHLRLRMVLTLAAVGADIPTHLLPHCFAGDALAGNRQPIWQRQFPHIFRQGGFDILLQNPPYLGQKHHRVLFSKLRQNKRWQNKILPKGDLLYLFFYLGMELLKKGGLMGLITTSYFTHAQSAVSLRQTLQQNTVCHRLIDFEDKRLFDTAPGQQSLLSIFECAQDPTARCICGLPPHQRPCGQTQLYEGKEYLLQTRPLDDFLRKILRKMENAPYQLGSVCRITNGLMTGCDKITKRHLSQHHLPGVVAGDGVFVLSQQEVASLMLTPTEKSKLKPFYKNSDIQRYRTSHKPPYFLIDFFYPNDRETDFSQYPHLMNHLAKFKTVLLARKQNNNGIDKQLAQGKYWFASVRRKMNFETDKLVIPQRARTNTVAYAPGPWYASSDVYFITAPQGPFSLWFLLGLLNTHLYYLWLFYRGKRKGKLLELYTGPLSQIPVPNTSPEEIAVIEQLALAQYRHYTQARQEQLNHLVAVLFQLSADEESVVQQFVSQHANS